MKHIISLVLFLITIITYTLVPDEVKINYGVLFLYLAWASGFYKEIFEIFKIKKQKKMKNKRQRIIDELTAWVIAIFVFYILYKFIWI